MAQWATAPAHGVDGLSPGQGGPTEWVVGIAIATVYAQLEMGGSWRIGVDERETTTLERTGVFGRIRNPICTAIFTFGLGSPW